MLPGSGPVVFLFEDRIEPNHRLSQRRTMAHIIGKLEVATATNDSRTAHAEPCRGPVMGFYEGCYWVSANISRKENRQRILTVFYL